jgi:hypothetical protein
MRFAVVAQIESLSQSAPAVDASQEKESFSAKGACIDLAYLEWSAPK